MSNDLCDLTFKPIGVLRSWYKSKNGTPRQGCIVPESRGIIELNKTFFDKPSLSLDGLDQFSHVWIIFYFHENTNKKVRAKIRPPRLNGASTGLFSTRSPHRPNAIGLSLSNIDKIEHNCIHVSGIDILDQTPILDIKPFILEYDYPKSVRDRLPVHDTSLKQVRTYEYVNSSLLKKLTCDPSVNNSTLNIITSIANNSAQKQTNESKNISEPDWISREVAYETISHSTEATIGEIKIKPQFQIIFTERAENQLHLFHSKNSKNHQLDHLIQDLKNVKSFYLNYKKEAKSNAATSDTSTRVDEMSCGEKSDLKTNDKIESKSEPLSSEVESESIGLDDHRSVSCKYCLEYLKNSEEAKSAIRNTLAGDPRSTYRRMKCSDRLYYFTIDTMHLSAWFDEEDRIVEIVKIKPNYIC